MGQGGVGGVGRPREEGAGRPGEVLASERSRDIRSEEQLSTNGS